MLGFTTHPEGDNYTARVFSDDLQDANRWSFIEGSLAEDGVRGLDGGIEYSISEMFCDSLAHHFVGIPIPTCSELREMIKSAFDMWSEGHPHLRFVDVSDRVDTVLDSYKGAEIDFFALTSLQYPKVNSFSAITSWWWDDHHPMSTIGLPLQGRSLTGVDIVFNVTERNCYYNDLELVFIQCNHFPSLVLHEVGHALGLSHPDQMSYRNFDTDSNPNNSMSISCDRPDKNFKLSQNLDLNAVMMGRNNQATPEFKELAPDDIGGRDFLYPICDLSDIAVASSGTITSDVRSGSEFFFAAILFALFIKLTRPTSVGINN